MLDAFVALMLWAHSIPQAHPSACDFRAAVAAADALLAAEPPPKAYSIVFLNRETCDLKQVMGRRVGMELAVPGFTVRPEKIWNGFNTSFDVVDPPGWVVLRNRYGHRRYTPHSTALVWAFPQLIAAGPEHFREDWAEALPRLRAAGTPSLALPELLAADIGEMFREDLERVAWAEHVEEWEETFDRPKFVVGANLDDAYPSCNRVGACGLMQIWRPTCTEIRRDHPSAKLPPDCNSAGTASHAHVVSIEAAILVYDQKLSEFIRAFGREMLQHPDLRMWLFAAYNGGTARLIPAILARGDQWERFHPHPKNSRRPAHGYITRETMGYLGKYRRLRAAEPAAIPATDPAETPTLPAASTGR